jgi:hypothetical protein
MGARFFNRLKEPFMPKTTPAAKTATAAPAKAAFAFPEGFVSPFSRVEMQPGVRIDDGLCCISMLTKQPLADVTKLAYELGVPEHGPAWVYSSILIKMLAQFNLVGVEKEINSIDALPDVALITTNYNPDTQYGRWALWHHVRGTEKTPAFHYAIDPAFWTDQPITTDFKRLLTPKQPIYYIEVTPKPVAKAKGK